MHIYDLLHRTAPYANVLQSHLTSMQGLFYVIIINLLGAAKFAYITQIEVEEIHKISPIQGYMVRSI